MSFWSEVEELLRRLARSNNALVGSNWTQWRLRVWSLIGFRKRFSRWTKKFGIFVKITRGTKQRSMCSRNSRQFIFWQISSKVSNDSNCRLLKILSLRSCNCFMLSRQSATSLRVWSLWESKIWIWKWKWVNWSSFWRASKIFLSMRGHKMKRSSSVSSGLFARLI